MYDACPYIYCQVCNGNLVGVAIYVLVCRVLVLVTCVRVVVLFQILGVIRGFGLAGHRDFFIGEDVGYM